MASLELKNVVKRYKSQTVLDDLSLTVADGETLVLFGPSGAGKTVLLRLVAGVIDPDEGKILIGGEDMTDVDAEFRGVGMAFQNFALFPHMSAFDNIATPLQARHSSQSAIKAGVESVAKLLKIDHVLSHKRARFLTARSSVRHLPRSGRLAAAAVARRSPAQCRCQAAFRDAARTAATSARPWRDRHLCHPGLQGGDGARQPHRCDVARRYPAARHT